jgi:ATP-dependent Clp protease protease subunit
MTLGDMLLENRLIFLQGPIYDEPIAGAANANELVMKLLYLQSENRRKPIHFYINSPGGSVTAMLAIYDTMRILSCPIATYCVGRAASGAALLLAGGTKGKRFALPHAEVMIHQPRNSYGYSGSVSDIEIVADNMVKMRTMLNELFAEHTGKSVKEVEKDTDRDYYMSAKEALAYGLVDDILTRPPSEEADEDGEDEKK